MMAPAALKQEYITETLVRARIIASCEPGPAIKTVCDLDFIDTTNG
ncbi:MAG: hypothetical protein GXO88_10550 [Chlorobi bacterium]|nr:hypothetical protein [Chlorobiota bacterium]